MKSRTVPAPRESRLLEETIVAARDAINAAVAAAVLDGLTFALVGLVVERALDGQLAVACDLRHPLAERFDSYPSLDDAAREVLAGGIRSAGMDEIPVAVVVHGPEYVSFGVRMMEGHISTTMAGPASPMNGG